MQTVRARRYGAACCSVLQRGACHASRYRPFHGVAAAWPLRVCSTTPVHVDGLGGPIAALVVGQCLLLVIWLGLLPGPLPPDVWQDDGYRYTLLATLVGLVSAFSNALLLWRVAGGPAPLRDPQELRRVHELGLRAARGQPPHDEPP